MKTELIEIMANGEPHRVAAPCTIEKFLANLGWKPTQVVVERNGVVVPRDTVASVYLAPGDAFEIIIPVAGG